MSQVYEIVTARIIERLEAGVAPWRKPWGSGAPTVGQAANAISRKPYRGVNAFLTACQGYSSPLWVTFKQAKELGGSVKSGAKGTPVVYLGKVQGKQNDASADAQDDRKAYSFLRYYTVFNIEQCEGLNLESPAAAVTEPRTFSQIASCEKVVADSQLRIRIAHLEPAAFYSPRLDYINMPRPESFHRAEEYYSTLFHEMTHATGHESRLDRGISAPAAFGSPDYSREELVAEMGAAFLCGHTGIETATLDNSAAYLAGWIKTLKGDPRLIVSAAAQAQKAADYILNA